MKLTKEQRIRLDHLNQHGVPVTRRDFLSLGFLGAAGLALMPKPSMAGIFQSFSQANMAPDFPSFLVIDCAGGAGLSGNFLVGKQGGAEDLLANYDQLGWNPRTSKIDKRFGLPMAEENISKIFQGIIQTASPEAQARFRMGSFLHASLDDTSGNPLSGLTLAAKSTQAQRVIGGGLGQTSSLSGANSRAVMEDALFKPIQVGSITDLMKSFTMAGAVGKTSPSRRSFLSGKMNELNKLQLKSFDRSAEAAQLQEYFGKSAQGLSDFNTIDTTKFDPRSNAKVAALYGLNANSAPNSADVIMATIAHNAISGNCGPSALTIGGCDYHDGSQTTGDAKDLQIGQQIGRAVQLAHINQRPLFIQIVTDGGVYSQPGSRRWGGDAGSKSMSVIGYYDPNNTPKYVDPTRVQIGHYTDGQGVERGTLIGDSPQFAAYAAFANYLNITGRLGEFEKFTPPRLFTAEQLESLLIFDKA